MAEAVKKEIDMSQIVKERMEQIRQGIVPEGYKETEIGIVPEDWGVKKLEGLGEVFRGKGISKSKLTDEGMPCVIYGELYTNYNNLIKVVASRTDNETAKNSFEIKYGDILFTGSGETAEEIGKSVMYVSDDPAYAGGDLIIFRPNEEIKNKVYGYLLNTEYVRKQKYKKAQGHSVVHIYGDNIKKLYIPFIPTKEQQKIADILSTWDRAIELKESLIKEKEEQKKGLMQEILKPEVSWKEMRLGDLSAIVTGTTPPTSVNEYYDGEYPWITPTDIKNDKYLYTSERTLTEKGMEKGRFVPKDSLLITCIASIGKNAILKKDGSCNQQINAIYPSETHSNEFLYYLITHNTNKLLSYAATTATAIINKQTFENIIFLFPSLEEQRKIANFLSTADKEISLLKQELEQLKEQKKGLMQLLLTGIVRVGEVE